MNALPPQTTPPDAGLPAEAGGTLFSRQTVTLTKQEHIRLKGEASYWKTQHERALQRIAELEKALEAERAKNRDLTHRLYGKQTEQTAETERTGVAGKEEKKRKRGAQTGGKGHGRTQRPDLAVSEEERDLPEADKCCPQCGEAFLPFPGSENSDIIEIEVRPYIRRIKRRRYQKGCQCPQTPGIITAPPAPRLIPKSPIGVSVWTEILSAKYLHSIPLNRIIADFEHHGLPLAAGTLTGGMQRIAPLFEPVMETFYEQQMTEKLFHSDETRREVFEELEGKTGHRWYLWAIRSASVVIFRVSPTRSADTPKIHFAGIRVLEIILLAFCWAHVRRDFLDAARSYPELEARMSVWVEDIRELYRLNAARVQVWDAALPLTEQAAEFTELHNALGGRLEAMQSRYQADLNAEGLHYAERKVLQSLQNHWEGLTHFLSHPEIPMDNNIAERTIRGPVTGRKNYYGSGSIWSAELAAMLFSLFQTLLLWKLNPHHWLSVFLQACAENGGNTPSDLSPFLPWSMPDEHREILSRPLLAERSESEIRDPEPEVPDTS